MSSTPPPVEGTDAHTPTCYRHPQRETWIACQRCDRPICPDCMQEASVGFQCPECVAAGAKSVRSAQGPYGGARSVNPQLTSIVLIGINALVWVAITLSPNGRLGALLSQSPLGICSPEGDPQRYFPGVEKSACLGEVEWFPGIVTGAWWQPLTSVFAHEAIWHVAMNMFALYLLGPHVERVFGRARFLAVYLVAGLTGSLAAFWLSDPQGSVLGASGAIWGLMGAMFVVARRVGADTSWLVQMIGLNVVITVVGAAFISWQGHLGGLVGGAAAAAVLVAVPRENRTRWQVLAMSGLVLAIAVGFVVRGVMVA